MTASPIPDWLAKRGGSVGAHSTGTYWLVTLDDQPQYRLTPKPVGGKLGCDVVATNNGHKIPSQGVFATVEDAIRGGLDDLRKALGW